MQTALRKTSHCQRVLLHSAIVAALGLGMIAAQAEERPLEEVIITGSRLQATGMQSPTPVTAVAITELSAMAPGALVEGLSQLPQFYGNGTPASLTRGSVVESWFTRGGYGNLDMRGLGINRTLTLLNSRRMISSTAFGGVDINVFPEAMIRSVESVTGGASAAYGTDAIAGVTNFILDTEFTGFQAHIQGGETSRGDSANQEGSIAYGTSLGDRAHILLSAEKFEQDGIFNYKDRNWYKAWGTIPDPSNSNRLLIRPQLVSRNSTFDGIIFAPGTSLNGMQFQRDGSVVPFENSDLFAFPVGIPPGRQSIVNGGSGDDLGAEVNTLFPDFDRESYFVYADYDLTDNFTVFGQYIKGSNSTTRFNAPRGSLHGTPTVLTIFQDNAYLPDSVRDTMIAEGIQSFTFKRMGSAEDIGADIRLWDDNDMDSYTAGFKWKVANGGMFDGWTVDAYYQGGENTRKWYQVGMRVDRIFAAVDAVRDPDSGQIVCRTTLFSDLFAGCQPLNLFGRGNASPEAVDWVVGNDPGEQISTPLFFADSGFDLGLSDTYIAQEPKVNTTDLDQDIFELSAAGDVSEGWGAGPISLALGGSYRQEEILQIVRDSTNKSSDHVNGHPVLCNNDPEAIAAGLRGVNGPDCANTVGIQYSKVSNIKGKIKVKEAFVEGLIPLIADQPFMRQMNLNLAARWANYTGSGDVWSWKGGLDLQITDDFRLRGTVSRDVRAANLSERFDKTGGVQTVTDPRYPADGTRTVTIFSGGNPNVEPEEADTITVGFVYQPSFIEGLSLSLDWYDVDISDAIGRLGTQAVLNRCEEGAEALCALITRDPTTDRLVLVGDVYININQAVVRGIDFEADYIRDINLFGNGNEHIQARLFASYLDENSETLAGTQKIDRAGQTGIQQSDGSAYALPDFKLTANLSYTYGPFNAFLQGRYIASGTNENKLPANMQLENNDVDAVFYMDLRLAYLYEFGDGNSVELYGTVTNVLDEDPPVTPYYNVFFGYPEQYNPRLFDLLGRRYVGGIRIRF